MKFVNKKRFDDDDDDGDLSDKDIWVSLHKSKGILSWCEERYNIKKNFKHLRNLFFIFNICRKGADKILLFYT